MVLVQDSHRSPLGPLLSEHQQSASAPGNCFMSTSRRCRAYPRGGHRALGRGCGSRRGAGTSCPRVAVDDNSRVAYAEQLPDERKETARAFMGRAIASCEGLGVAAGRAMTDNGPAYRSGEFNALLGARGIGHKYTGPFSPWRNGKVERMNRTLAREWQYARAWEGEEARASSPWPPSSSATIGTVRAARAGACLRCHA